MNDIFLKKPVFICAGEPSGDLYAGLFVKELRQNNINSEIYGVGGDDMQKNGVNVLINYYGLMTFGFSMGIFSIFRHYRVYKRIAREIYRTKSKTFIAVAYPGINLLLCRYARKMGCDVYYFLPPQIWAWGGFRRYFIKKWVDIVISVFPFEHAFYKRKGIETIYLENPLFEELKKYRRNNFKKTVGFMPGSRPSEIKRNFPIILEFAKRINQTKSDIEFCLISPPDVLRFDRNLLKHWNLEFDDCLRFRHSKLEFDQEVRQYGFEFKLVTEKRYQAMKNCDLLITSSGTASLEAAIMQIPQVFFNRPSFLDFYVFKHLLKIREYNLANLYYEKKIVQSVVSRSKYVILQKLSGIIDKYR